MVSITVYANDTTIVKYGLTGIKDLNIEDYYDGDANTNDYTTDITKIGKRIMKWWIWKIENFLSNRQVTKRRNFLIIRIILSTNFT